MTFPLREQGERGRTILDGGLDAPVLTAEEVTQALARIIDRLSVLERECATLQVDVQALLEWVQGRERR